MTDQLDVYEMHGWDGPTIPLEAQTLILMRKYQSAVEVVARNAGALHKQVTELLNGVEDGGAIAGRLATHPFCLRVISKLQDSADEFGDSGFRKNAGELFDEARDELEDMVTWTAMALWVLEGATFPPGLLEQYGVDEVEGDEEE